MLTVLKGHSIREVEDHCSRGFYVVNKYVKSCIWKDTAVPLTLPSLKEKRMQGRYLVVVKCWKSLRSHCAQPRFVLLGEVLAGSEGEEEWSLPLQGSFPVFLPCGDLRGHSFSAKGCLPCLLLTTSLALDWWFSQYRHGCFQILCTSFWMALYWTSAVEMLSLS